MLRVFGISLVAFSIAGGGVLTWIGFSMLRGNSPQAQDPSKNDTAAFTPLILFAASRARLPESSRWPLRNGSNKRTLSVGRMPCPLSFTITSTAPPSIPYRICREVTGVDAIASIAFITRFKENLLQLNGIARRRE